jgi:hypothetical protein
MKILIVSAKFYPQNNPRAFRTTELAKELSKFGNEVTILIPDLDYDYTSLIKKHKFSVKLYKLKWDKKSLSVFGKQTLLYRIIDRLLSLLIEYPDIEISHRIRNYLLSTNQSYDAIISIAVPHPVHWGVALARKEKLDICKIWIADSGDPYMGCNPGTNIFNKHPFYFSIVEKWAFRKADFITVPIEEAKSGYYKEFHSKIKIIPQGFNFDDIVINQQDPNNDKLSFAYAGSFYQLLRDPRPFLDYLVSIDKEFKFIIHTDPSFEDILNPYKEKLAGKLEIHPFIPRNELLSKLSKMDFLVNFENAVKIQSPSKLIDYALTGRPILNIPYGHMDTDVINQFLVKNYSKKILLSNLDDYNIKNVANQFLKLVDINLP